MSDDPSQARLLIDGMVINQTGARSVNDRVAFDQLLGELRPKLHRYCARMAGSVLDGEDILQDALLKAIEAFPEAGPIGNMEGWVFRIAHNTALDFLRRRTRQNALQSDGDPDMVSDPVSAAAQRLAAAASLRTFMRLPVAQRSSIILMDVLGYSLEEIGEIMGATIPATKAALHRGRVRLREFAQEPDDHPLPALAETERVRLAAYVERFNARDFDTLRNLLAEDVHLELVNKLKLSGRKEVGTYFHNYGLNPHWHVTAAIVENRQAALVREPANPAAPAYFIMLEWADGSLVGIRDFRFARYATESAYLLELG